MIRCFYQLGGRIALALFLYASPLLSHGANSPILRSEDRIHPVIGNGGMVATQERHATEAAVQVLAEGGNAVDAAVTAALTLAVTLPRAGNLGGGGFMLIYDAQRQESVAIDYRETAPSTAHRDMFLDASGEVDESKARRSHLSAGVPGTVRGLALALEQFGTISWQRALSPAIRLASQGFRVGHDLASSLVAYKSQFAQNSAAMQAFYRENGTPYSVGDVLIQADLATSLRGLAEDGPDHFYRGRIADQIVADMKAHGGIISHSDLANYRPRIRKPVIGTYRDHRIVSMPPPSSGGIHLIQMLNILEQFPIREFGHNSSATIHILTESAKPAYADRSKYLGDSDFVSVPLSDLTSKRYARKLAALIQRDKAIPSEKISPGLERQLHRESHDTTHFSVIDQDGNAVANTYTLNFSYGSKIVVPGTGILLNNEMDDFSAKPGVPNGYGLLGGEHNAIAPNKRMLSSMTPTLIFSPDGTVTATGSPGGSRIITTVLQVVSNLVDHQLNVAEATFAPRMHHQWFPDTLYLEKGFSPDTLTKLQRLGHDVAITTTIGSTQTVQKQGDVFYGASDPRRSGAATMAVKDLN